MTGDETPEEARAHLLEASRLGPKGSIDITDMPFEEVFALFRPQTPPCAED